MRWPCIHGSQKIKSKTDSDVYIELNLQVNYELSALLFSYMDSIEIIEPKDLRVRLKEISENLFLKYK